MTTNPNFPPLGPGEPSKERSEQAGEVFDANRFGSFRLSSGFFRWAIATPLPKADPEDLWQDTLPPGQLSADVDPSTSWPEETSHLRGPALGHEDYVFGRPAKKKSHTHLLVFAAVIWGGVIVGAVLLWPFGGPSSSAKPSDVAVPSVQITAVSAPEVEQLAPSVEVGLRDESSSAHKPDPGPAEVPVPPSLVSSTQTAAHDEPVRAPARRREITPSDPTPSAYGSSAQRADSEVQAKKAAPRFGLK